ncbi:hypothetical protein APY04_0771 [Hyphomicrobium sulfonivorans]|uniref:Uncharacterized protein n=1 Tax=Hyphomicrobium sulfonivorans TaxID=121290 RepID=A0A120CXC1_HYPSL|nr:hypothetical protein [Hyphomicrobium sulfonivorans]KWT70710.1 hypothetical protein APY04_0771 [Hyphomicrobium sulfonivorans]
MLTYKQFMALPKGAFVEIERTRNGVNVYDLKTGRLTNKIKGSGRSATITFVGEKDGGTNG